MTNTKQVIVVRSDLKMVTGKEDAQVAHAGRAFLARKIQKEICNSKFSCKLTLSLAERDWVLSNQKTVVVVAHSEIELLEIKLKALRAGLVVNEIVDAGLTQFGGKPTLTCIAIGPDYNVNIDPITNKLRLR